ncbi:hypothetical protein GE09DRAFT_1263590 [Coniochaeta sp. 2T2.1]|nr:hypothetical protein GE09DRAFT_1263590 [Coniochaeta sp. 2T2.1]
MPKPNPNFFGSKTQLAKDKAKAQASKALGLRRYHRIKGFDFDGTMYNEELLNDLEGSVMSMFVHAKAKVTNAKASLEMRKLKAILVFMQVTWFFRSLCAMRESFFRAIGDTMLWEPVVCRDLLTSLGRGRAIFKKNNPTTTITYSGFKTSKEYQKTILNLFDMYQDVVQNLPTPLPTRLEQQQADPQVQPLLSQITQFILHTPELLFFDAPKPEPVKWLAPDTPTRSRSRSRSPSPDDTRQSDLNKENDPFRAVRLLQAPATRACFTVTGGPKAIIATQRRAIRLLQPMGTTCFFDTEPAGDKDYDAAKNGPATTNKGHDLFSDDESYEENDGNFIKNGPAATNTGDDLFYDAVPAKDDDSSTVENDLPATSTKQHTTANQSSVTSEGKVMFPTADSHTERSAHTGIGAQHSVATLDDRIVKAKALQAEFTRRRRVGRLPRPRALGILGLCGADALRDHQAGAC